MLVAAGPAAAADDPDPLGRLEAATAACREETARLEELAADPRLGGTVGMIDLAGYLAGAEARVWVLAAEVEGLAATEPLWVGDEPAALSTTWAVAMGDWAGAAARFAGISAGVAAAAEAGADGLPAPGRTCPLEQAPVFASTWEEERPWGREHHGADLDADSGTPLVAIESGTILQADWHWAGGWGIWLQGLYSGDTYYYAHLQGFAPAVAAGVEVGKGELLGWVGSSGNAGSPHLHFGWVPRDSGPWYDLAGLADPYPLLAGLCR